MVELIKINMTCEHEKSGSDQVLTSPGGLSEPRTSDDSGTLGPDVITALRLLTEMIKLWPPGHKQGFPM